jgi:hypothetical protein
MSGFAEEGFRMASVRASDEAKRRAFGHVIGSIDSAASFPAQVFLGSWDAFLFFESDRLFAPGFAVIATSLLNAERADVCCLLNFNETDRMVYEAAAMLFVDAGTEPHAYDAMLRRGGPANGWLFGVDRYGSASDRGGWSIYCEKGNDVAAIALRRPDDIGKYCECLKQLHAEPITVLLKAGSAAFVPFGQLTKPWRRGLTQHYADHGC